MSGPTTRFDCPESDDSCLDLRHRSIEAGVSDPRDLPYMLRPQAANTAVLLVHGFTATPREMRPLAEALAEAGIASLAVCLPGHGTTAEDLADRRWEEWLHAVREGQQVLSREFISIHAMGMSTGCLLLLTLATMEPFRSLVLFSPYLRIRHRLAPFAGWLRWIRPFHEKQDEPAPQPGYYRRRPVAAVHQINRLLKRLRNQLPQVVCPVLAFNGEGDQTVDIASSRQLVTRLGSPFKIHEIYGPDVPHVLTGEDNPCRRTMFDQAIRFVQELDDMVDEEETR